jgi:methylated-DNA-[protein]-cysteine S-methyltransferase
VTDLPRPGQPGIRFVETERTTRRHYAVVDSPLGKLLLIGDGQAITRLDLLSDRLGGSGIDATWAAEATPLAEAIDQLREYFAGSLTIFDLSIALEGTAFQRQVWQRLAEIPYGVTITYGDLARSIGRPNGARAVGGANGCNPVPIILPCHRVLAASGALTGYGLGGLQRKRWLLDLETTGETPHTDPERDTCRTI